MGEDGSLDFDYFERMLQKYSNYNALKVGAFSAASNITGNLLDVDRIAVLLHQYKALACFDYAAAAPYI